MRHGIVYGLLAAVLFGASTPLAKLLLGQAAPLAVAALLYLGSGLGLLACDGLLRVRRGAAQAQGRLTASDLPWLGGAIFAGGVAGPVLLMLGLSVTPASTASLLLNTEAVLTSALAWFVFKENLDRRLVAGMALIVAAGVLLSWDGPAQAGSLWGPLAIVAACLCWAVDNNLTRKVSASDALQIASVKGLLAGSVNLVCVLALGIDLPAASVALEVGLLGFVGYGLSLVCFVLALRQLGAARTGAYFSAAPFVGAALSIAVLGEAPGAWFWLAAAMMGAGLWLHLTEVHEHEHAHDALEHAHAHTHDEHHQHEHEPGWDGHAPHTHSHRHAELRHTHRHFPDIHHRHPH